MSNSTPNSSGRPAEPQQRPRTVSHLPEEQIARKRSIDPRAQRVFRQRTRNCIADLEERLAMVTDSAARREAELLAEVHSLRCQCRMLKRCLDSIVDIASGLDPGAEDDWDDNDYPDNHFDGHDGDDAHTESPHVHHSLYNAVANTGDDIPSSARSQPPAPNPTREHVHRNSNPDAYIYGAHSASTDPNGGGGSTSMRIDPPYDASPLDRLPHPELVLETPEASAVVTPIRPDLPSTVAPTSSDAGFLKFPTSNNSSGHLASYNTQGRSSASAVLPQHVHPTCPLDRILLDFLHSRKEMVSQGVPMETVLGPQKAIMTGLIDPSLAPTVHPISRVLSEVLSTFPNVELPQKMGMFYKIYLTMRWQVSPTTENYTQMPVWLRPTVTQIAIPHAAWIDNIPWPDIRDLLIEYPDKYPFEIFSEYYSQNVSVNWHFDDNDAVAHEDGCAVLHSIFEKHIRNLDNWTVKREFENKFPEMSHIIFARG